MSASAIPPERISELSVAAADLIHHGLLVSIGDEFRLQQAASSRTAFEPEQTLEARLEQDPPLAAVETIRSIATEYPEAFNAAVTTFLESQPQLDDLRKVNARFSATPADDQSSVAISLCNQIEETLKRGRFEPETDAFPPVSGGDDAVGCGMIALGSMGGGAACVIGCVPCCPVAAAGGLIFLGLCS
ncbi:MAG: hypothetical protein KC438_06555 [Thermomicrobiales bacterium]|nr:hypothetical protein [Thermomicrobiales bacterium]MCO5222793.1 hypothetical protein [Thermomicrobiales bacterium]